MSITTTSTKDSYTGNNSTSTPYPITFKYLEDSHITVYVDGVALSNSYYTLTGDGSLGTGQFTTALEYASTQKVVVVLDVPFNQPVELLETGALSSSTLEEAYDRLNMQIRRVWRKAQGVLTFSSDEGGASSTGTADNLIGFDGNGDLAEIPNSTFLSSTSSINDLTDTTITNPVSGETLEWNGSAWINQVSGSTVTASDTAPVSPNAGDLWFDSTTTQMFVYYYDGSSSQWVTVTSGSPSTDSDTVTYTPAGSGAVATTVENKLRENVSVKDFGAVGDGVTDDTTAIQNAVNSLSLLGGGVLYVPYGVYRVSSIALIDNLHILAEQGASFKMLDGISEPCIFNPNQTSTTTIKNILVENLIFDGNKANSSLTKASSAATVNGAEDVVFRKCTFRNALGYGLGFQAYPTSASIPSTQKNISLYDCIFHDNGDGIGGDKYDGVDVKYVEGMAIANCTAYNNANDGFDVRGESVSLHGCYAYNNLADGFELKGNHNGVALASSIQVTACNSVSNGGIGFHLADGSASATQKVRINLTGCNARGNTGSGIATNSASSLLQASIIGCNVASNTDGIYIADNAESIIIEGCVLRNNTNNGIKNVANAGVIVSGCQINSNSNYGYEETGTGSRSLISSSEIKGNTTGSIGYGTSNKRLKVCNTVLTYNQGASTDGDVIASASTITIPEGADYIAITGTTNIDTINNSARGRVITLHFTGVLTVNDSTGNLKLSSDFTSSSDDTLTLVSKENAWLEIARSSN